MSMQEFRGKTAIVTGAASGIGFGIAQALAEAGVNLVLADIQPDKLEAARAKIEAMGVAAIGVTVDVSDAESVAAVGRAAVEKFGRLHVAVNNAGVAMHGTKLLDVGLDEWRWVVGVNVMGAVHGIRSFVPLIRQHGEGGHVVNTASISGFFVREGANQGAYSMSKYAVVALSEALEQELAGSGIGVSVLCPGATNTNLFASAALRPDRFGGAYSRAAQEQRTLAAGVPPEVVGRRVVQGMRDGTFYIVTDGSERDAVQARHRRIEAAFAAAGAFSS
jgi:NAD(P)-dependent dehydrogenase (short-subunit alcohol dehydrogenase family)